MEVVDREAEVDVKGEGHICNNGADLGAQAVGSAADGDDFADQPFGLAGEDPHPAAWRKPAGQIIISGLW